MRPARPLPPRRKAEGAPTPRQRVLGWAILIAATALFLYLTVQLCRPLARLASDPKKMRAFVQSQGAFGRVAFLGIEILQGFLPIPLELSAIAGGYVFGHVQGWALTICSVLISTTLIFHITKMYGHRLVDLFIPRDRQKSVRWFRSGRVRDAVTFFVFLIPGTPKRLFVFTAGMVPQNFWRFLFISTAARAPALLICSFGGGALGSGDYGLAVFLLAVGVLLGAAGFVIYRRVSGGGGVSPQAPARRGERREPKAFSAGTEKGNSRQLSGTKQPAEPVSARHGGVSPQAPARHRERREPKAFSAGTEKGNSRQLSGTKQPAEPVSARHGGVSPQAPARHRERREPKAFSAGTEKGNSRQLSGTKQPAEPVSARHNSVSPQAPARRGERKKHKV